MKPARVRSLKIFRVCANALERAFASSPRDAGAGRGPRRGASSHNVPPLFHRMEYVFSVLAAPVAQSCTLSVSVQIVAGRDDFAERGSVSRSTLKATDALDLSKRWAAGKAPAGHRPALLWLRLGRAAPYRGFVICRLLQAPARLVSPAVCRLQVSDTTDWKSALQSGHVDTP